MTPAEAATVLAVAATFDPRLRPPTPEDARARASAWAIALDDMPPVWAERAVVAHYAAETAALMPAHLNAEWRRQRRARAEKNHSAALGSIPEGTPMPDSVRMALTRRTAHYRAGE